MQKLHGPHAATCPPRSYQSDLGLKQIYATGGAADLIGHAINFDRCTRFNGSFVLRIKFPRIAAEILETKNLLSCIFKINFYFYIYYNEDK